MSYQEQAPSTSHVVTPRIERRPPPSKAKEKRATAIINLIAGGGGGIMEALACHPLDTIKVQMQLSKKARVPGAPRVGFLKTGSDIVKQHGPLAIYRGFGAVFWGIIPKMGVRFASFETYKPMLADKETGALSDKAILAAGLAAGITEAVTVVTPMEVLKVRLQGQSHSYANGATGPKYRNVAHAVYVICREEGFGALYNGVFLTALRQGTNQAVNLTVYTKLKQFLRESQPAYANVDLPAYQTALCGLVAGGSGPLFNAPIDTLKTRVQQSPMKPGETGLTHIIHIARDMFKQEGYHALYKGVTPRILRVGPGQALTYTGYEFFKTKLQPFKEFLSS